jgi:hypothetical protein
MNRTDDARPFFRSEAFPEDVADIVAPTPRAAAVQQPGRGTKMVWLLGLLPLVALAVGVTWVV